MKTLKEKAEISKCLACNGTGLVEIGNVGHFNSSENTYCKMCNATGIVSLKENKLREEFITLLADYQITVSSEFPNQNDIDIILCFINSKFDELERRIREEKVECPCGKYCVQEGRNEGLENAISILNEMRGEK